MRVVFHLQGLAEQQLAWYPGDGAGYARHTDAMPDDRVDSDQRKLTVILYCNRDWIPANGGALRLWLPECEGGRTVDVEPISGRLLIFLSGCMMHEVLPSYRNRCAITSWYR